MKFDDRSIWGIPLKYRHLQSLAHPVVHQHLMKFSSSNFSGVPEHQEKTDHHPLDLTGSSTTIPRVTKWAKFNKLDQMKKPGLSEVEFWGLFVKCDNCQRITTPKVFRYHLEDCEGYQHEGLGDTDTSKTEQES